MEYQQIAAAAFFFRVQYGSVAPFGVFGFWNGAGGVRAVLCLAHCWVLRQQDRLSWLWLWLRDLCFWFPGCIDDTRSVCGVCGLGLLFENYIVDASIFYKKQFPRYMNLDLLSHPFGVG